MRRRGRTSRPASRQEAQASSRQRRQERLDRPPTWRGAINRAVLAAAVFCGVLVLLLRQSIGYSLTLSLFMFIVYIPLGYSMDSVMYRVRQRRKEQKEQ